MCTYNPDTYNALVTIHWFLTGEFIMAEHESTITCDLYNWWLTLQEDSE